MNSKRRNDGKNFETSLWTGLGIGVLAAATFYSLMKIGLLRNEWLDRYANGHPVSVAAVYLFCIASAVLIQKLLVTWREIAALRKANESLLDLMQAVPTTGVLDVVRWLDSMWRAQPEPISRSFFGNRLTRILRRQIQRNSCEQMDNDLQELAGEDADLQHDGYSIVRIICWAMPMLGFLGTVVGISQTLGNLDMQSLASGDASAMDKLTGGLYIAFDTTAVGLVLTIIAMFVQFAVGGLESRLLYSIDTQVADRCYAFVKAEAPAAADYTSMVQSLAERIVDGTSAALSTLLEKQVAMWQESAEQINEKWRSLQDTSGANLTESLHTAISQSVGELSKHVERIQATASETLESRYQQWQTTFSEQSRAMLQTQAELTRQSELLTKLIETCDGFAGLEQSVQQTLTRMTDVDRFHEAAVCLTEAVAMLGIQMERSGQIGRAVRAKPRSAQENLFESIDPSVRKAA